MERTLSAANGRGEVFFIAKPTEVGVEYLGIHKGQYTWSPDKKKAYPMSASSARQLLFALMVPGSYLVESSS